MTAFANQEQLKSILLGALDLEGEAREELIEERCAGDEVLREQVEELLRAYEDSPEFLAEPESVDPKGEGPGVVIGHFKLLQQIGEGGFGTVWMAEQLEPVRRKVALKIIKLGMDTKQVVARFEAERQALALMDHPNIAKVLDGGATENGRPYFVMELVRGVPITEYCDEAKLSTRARLELFVDVCQAVQHAHQKGIIHRDIKPTNVMVTLHDGRPVPMVIDFGIAKATSGSLTEKTLFTEFRQFLGTPQYMSPEQAEISGLDVDTRADIYSLGVLLYELLTGTTPFDPATLREAAYDEILRVIREEEPPRPSTRVSTLGGRCARVARARATEPGALQRLMSGDLDWIVMKALEKERSRRYDSSASFALDIQRYLSDEPVEACPPSRTYRLRKFARRNRVVVLAGALVALALLGGTGAATAGFLQASSQRDNAVTAGLRAEEEAQRARDAEGRALQEASNAREAEEREREQRQLASASAERASEETAAAEAINAFYDEMLVSVDPMRLRHRSGFSPAEDSAHATAEGMARDVSVSEMLRSASASVEASFAGKPDLEAKVRETIGVTLLGLGLAEEAARELELAYEHQADSGAEVDALRVQFLIGTAVSLAGDNAEAEPLLRAALAGMEQLHGADDPRTLHAASVLGRVLAQRGSYGEAEELLLETLEGQRRALTSEHRDTVDTLNQLTNVHLWQTDGLTAQPYAEEAYAISQEILSPDDIVRAEAERGLGMVRVFLLDYAGGEELLRPALEKLRRIAGEDHESTLQASLHLARCLKDESEQTEREQLLRHSVAGLAGAEQLSPSLFVARQDLAVILFDRGQFAEAIELARANVESRQAADGGDSARTREAAQFLRAGLYRAGQIEEAEEAFRELVALNDEAYGRDHVRTCSSLGDLTNFLRSAGRLDESRETWRLIIDLRRRMAEAPGAGALAHWGHGDTLLDPWAPDMRDAAAALAAFERAQELDDVASRSHLRDLTLAHHLLGNEAEASEAAARLLDRCAWEASGGHPDALLFYAEQLLHCVVAELRDPEAALPLARRAVEKAEDPAQALRVLARASALTGQMDEAREAHARLIQLLAEQAGATEAGIAALNDYVWAMVSAPFEELRDSEVIATHVEQLAVGVEGDPLGLNTLGLAQYRLGRFAEATASLEEADRLNRFRGDVYNRATDLIVLAMCYHELGDAERAHELVATSTQLLEGDVDLTFVDEQELLAFLSEAEALIGAVDD